MGGMSACIVSFEPANATHPGPYITACTLLVVMWLVIVTAWLLADVMQGGCCSHPKLSNWLVMCTRSALNLVWSIPVTISNRTNNGRDVCLHSLI